MARETEREHRETNKEQGYERNREGEGKGNERNREGERTREWERGIDREEICGIISLIRGIITEPNKHKFVFYFALINL
jgi:hypothetical protein